MNQQLEKNGEMTGWLTLKVREAIRPIDIHNRETYEATQAELETEARSSIFFLVHTETGSNGCGGETFGV